MKYLYTSPLPESSATDERGTVAQRLAEQGVLDGGSAAVESISAQAPDLVLEGQIRWGEEISTVLARSLRELATGSSSPLPLFRREGDWGEQGYYEVSQAEIEPLHASSHAVWRYSLSLLQTGTPASYRRAVSTKPQSDETYPLADSSSEIAAPAAATEVKWFDEVGKTIEPATAQRTVTGEHGDHAIYETTDTSIDDPALVYDIPLSDEYGYDARVWDDYDRSKTTTVNGASVVQWQRVFTPDHEFRGAPVIETDRIRLRLDVDAGTLAVSRWDTGSSSYSTVSSVDSTWELAGFDLVSIGQARVTVQCEFRDTVDGATTELNLTAERGLDGVLVTRPVDATRPATPYLLETWAQGTTPYAGAVGNWSRQSASTRSGYRIVGEGPSANTNYPIYATQDRDVFVAGDAVSVHVEDLPVYQGVRLALAVQDPTASNPDRIYIEALHNYYTASGDPGEVGIYEVSNGTTTQLNSVTEVVYTGGVTFEVSTSESDGETKLTVDYLLGSDDTGTITATTTTGLTRGSVGVEHLVNDTSNDQLEVNPIFVDSAAEQTVPAGLFDLLTPAARNTDTAATPTKTLVEREALRR